MSLNKNLIDPLQKHWRFITETKIGRYHIISLTEGENTPCISLVQVLRLNNFLSMDGPSPTGYGTRGQVAVRNSVDWHSDVIIRALKVAESSWTYDNLLQILLETC